MYQPRRASRSEFVPIRRLRYHVRLWGEPGPGRWITVYANAGHVWMEVAGWRFDTVALAEGGTRWSRGAGESSGYVVRHPPGL